ncbi:hypothetical protein N9N28_15040 [Rubripirellula amarantea]|nr:hypothetical protein [Rubripirellula amarantea]
MSAVIRLDVMLNWLLQRNASQTGWSANVFLTDDTIVIHSCSRTYNNRGWYNQPVFSFPADSEPSTIGGFLRSALNSSVWDSQTDDSQLSPHPVYHEAGFDSWRSLEENSHMVMTNSDKKTISIIPTRRVSKDEGRGFTGLDDQSLVVEWYCDDTELGCAVKSAFKLSLPNKYR